MWAFYCLQKGNYILQVCQLAEHALSKRLDVVGIPARAWQPDL